MNELPKRILSLTKRRYFLLLKEKGRRFSRPTMVVQMMPREASEFHVGIEDAARIGFTVTKQQGGAVTRNRIKRRLRAVCMKVFPLHGRAGCDYALIGRTEAARADFETLQKDLQFALDRLHAGKEKSPTTASKPL